MTARKRREKGRSTLTQVGNIIHNKTWTVIDSGLVYTFGESRFIYEM